jgi:hypothetical protein
VEWNGQTPGLGCRLYAGAGRLRDHDIDPVALDAAAAEPFVAFIVATFVPVSVIVRRQPELGAGIERRPVAVQPGFQRRPGLEPGRWAGIAVPVPAETRWRQWLEWQPGDCRGPGG